MKKAWNRKKVLTNKDVLDLMIKQKFKPIFAHNARFDYCNTNYVILALIIERATGQNYRDAMQTLIFKPLGMKNTFVFNYETDRDTVCKSYRASTIFPWDQYDNLYGDKNVYSTPRDLVKFDLATYSPDFINPEVLKEAYISYSPYLLKHKKDYGLGIRMKQLPNGENLWYHNGWWHGNTSSFIPMKKDTVTIICLSNVYTTRTYETMKLAEIY
jgi:CubicO group peptidase (beta-lactamase class C family)